MLIEKEVGKYYNTGEAEPWNIETITFSYNEKGDVTKENVTNTAPYSENYETTYTYTYDSHGNWIKSDARMVTVPENPQSEPRTWSSERQIIYY